MAEPPTKSKSPAKPSLNTQIYESENKDIEFSAVVKVVREVQDEIQIFFEGKPGFYVLQNATHQQRLVKSMENKRPVRVQIDSEARLIKNVELPD